MTYDQLILLSNHLNSLRQVITATTPNLQAGTAEEKAKAVDSAMKFWVEIYPESPIKQFITTP